ncbi:MAG: hypothetical protein WBW87_07785 [Candidatus Cybelea sp.]
MTVTLSGSGAYTQEVKGGSFDRPNFVRLEDLSRGRYSYHVTAADFRPCSGSLTLDASHPTINIYVNPPVEGDLGIMPGEALQCYTGKGADF